MKFLIKTSAIGVSDTKSVPSGTYETDDKQEIERLQAIAKRFPDDLEVVKESKPTPPPKQNPPADDPEDDKTPPVKDPAPTKSGSKSKK